MNEIKLIARYALVPVLFVVLLWSFFAPAKRVGYTPKQPIAYSHKLHAGQYGLDCRYCHSGVTRSKKAGIPSLNTCLNCHVAVGYGKPEVQKIHTYLQKKKTPEWVRVHNLPDHVRFAHAIHIKALHKPNQPIKQACAVCHGDVANMEVVGQAKSLNMGFCIDCHRKESSKGAKLDCTTCHY